MQHQLNTSYPGGFEQLSRDVSGLRYRTQVSFYDSLGLKMKGDAFADKERGRAKLSETLFAISNALFLARDAMIILSAIDTPYARLHTSITAYENDFDPLTKELGDLRYDRLAEFLEILSEETHAVFLEVKEHKASLREITGLASVTNSLMTAKMQSDIAWIISEPHMKPDGSC